jgi:hypothetical protein
MGDHVMSVAQKSMRWTEIEERIEFFGTVVEGVLYAEIGTSERRSEVLRILSILARDPVNGPTLEGWLTQANQSRSSYWEIRTLLHWFATRFAPRTYLEVGIRLGWSMAQVVTAFPEVDVYGVDLWIPGYASADNPGPSLVRRELRQLGHRGRLSVFSGNSHRVLPRAFSTGYPSRIQKLLGGLGRAESWPNEFDLILVDGDHSVAGAKQDLLDVIPHCALGGMVVFDDLGYEGDERRFGNAKNSSESLLSVWESVHSMFPGFRFFSNLGDEPGTGFAVRLN